VVVFRHDEDETVRTLARGRESLVLDLLTRVVSRKLQFTDVNQLSVYAFTLLDLLKHKPRYIFTRTALPHGAEDDWNE
jgi:hypothetical protein